VSVDLGVNADEPRLIDLMHLGRPRVIGAWRVGDTIVDPGPASCLEALSEEFESERPPRVLALTHIHLDHAGATGSLVRRFPQLEVWVHERGAPHLIDPGKLLSSAGRLYGEHMQTLWGEVLPVPAERIRVLRGGERMEGGMRVAYTPGHASHHVSYLHEPTGWVFAGDVAGVRVAGGPAIAPTPPPDIDLAAWRASIELIAAWRPSALAITHFGVHRDVQAQLGQLLLYLDEAEVSAGDLDAERFRADMQRRIAGLPEEIAATYQGATSIEQNFAGLARYLRGREQASAPAGAPER
jgi:glyoxylase-like metal-dependent hydrolase (beta-lactamase superfamily II)